MSDEITLNVKGLDKFIKALNGKPPVARVGIINDKVARPGSASNNAQIGAAHEFGTSTIPQRSFLRIPIMNNLDKKIDESELASKKEIAEVIRSGSLLAWTKKLAKIAEGIVIEAFDTGGYGKWPPSNMVHKEVKQTLVETGQLRDSITSDVKE